MNIESAGRHKAGSLYVKAKDHQLVQRPSGRIDRDYHGDGSIAQTYSKSWKPCCEDSRGRRGLNCPGSTFSTT